MVIIHQDRSVPNDKQSDLKENNAYPFEIIQNLKGFRTGDINIASLTKYILVNYRFIFKKNDLIF